MSEIKDLCQELTAKIQLAYEQGTTLEQAERLASEFLYAQIQISQALQNADLNARMRKSGVKAVRAAIYMEAATKDSKKPSDVLLQALVDMNEIVQGEQKDLDDAEVELEALERYYNIFKDAHIHFRGVSRGKFE